MPKAPKAAKLPPILESQVQAIEKQPDDSPLVTRWIISLPGWRPTTLNELLSAHWAKAGRMKAADRRVICTYGGMAGVPRATGKRRVSLKFVLPKGRKRWDRDNVWKSVLDSCVKCGWLKNDSPDWCEAGEVEYERGDKYSTTIVIEDVC